VEKTLYFGLDINQIKLIILFGCIFYFAYYIKTKCCAELSDVKLNEMKISIEECLKEYVEPEKLGHYDECYQQALKSTKITADEVSSKQKDKLQQPYAEFATNEMMNDATNQGKGLAKGFGKEINKALGGKSLDQAGKDLGENKKLQGAITAFKDGNYEVALQNTGELANAGKDAYDAKYNKDGNEGKIVSEDNKHEDEN